MFLSLSLIGWAAGVEFQRQAVWPGGEEHGGHGPQHPEGGAGLREEEAGTVLAPRSPAPPSGGRTTPHAAALLCCLERGCLTLTNAE